MTEIQATLENIFAHIEKQKEHYVKDLAEIVNIASVSTEHEHQQYLTEALSWTEKRLKVAGVECSRVDICSSKVADECSQMPHVLKGSYGHKVGKHTILVYSHVDVVRANPREWETPPFELQERDGILRGRGACTKAPLLCWIHAIEAFHATQHPVPLNVKFLIEALKERGSEGLAELVQDKERIFFDDVSFVCVPAGVWLDNSKPCINYSSRGYLHFKVKVEGPKRDLHSGFYGGMFQEPLGDLVSLLSSLQDGKGRNRIPGLRDEDVLPITDDDIRGYRALDIDMEHMLKASGATALDHKGDKVRVLLHTTRIPSISIHGIEGAYAGPGQKTVIPAKVVGRFSVHLVPHQTVGKTRALVEEHIKKSWASRKSTNLLQVDVVTAAEPWSGRLTDSHFEAASHSVERVFGIKPQLAPSAYSVPFAAQMPAGSSIVIMPIVRPADMLNAPNEGISLDNYVAYVKVFAAYIFEINQLEGKGRTGRRCIQWEAPVVLHGCEKVMISSEAMCN